MIVVNPIDVLEKRHAILVTEFNRYVVEHPEFAAEIPQNAKIVLQDNYLLTPKPAIFILISITASYILVQHLNLSSKLPHHLPYQNPMSIKQDNRHPHVF